VSAHRADIAIDVTTKAIPNARIARRIAAPPGPVRLSGIDSKYRGWSKRRIDRPKPFVPRVRKRRLYNRFARSKRTSKSAGFRARTIKITLMTATTGNLPPFCPDMQPIDD
jgi:hypothetical protein